MKILSINSIYNNINKNTPEPNNHFLRKNTGMGDVISFSAKKYDAESITNPTNHCAYCGCKVYTEQQIDSIAKEILTSKYDKLQGKIKSVLEKLDGAKHSEELALAKRLENEDEIKFFQNFLEIASKKSYLKGAAIFEQVYDQDSEQALNTLTTNLRPLLKTIDHVSPQNEEKENNNSDINLVEACWCCNHDLKKGVPFIEFYTMYPSIKNNMPSEKFQAASSSILDFQSNGIIQRLSAANLLKTIQRLFIQKKEANTYLDSIDFRIKNSTDAIKDAITSSRGELVEKESELRQKEQQFEELQQDDEFRAILERISLQKGIETQNGIISQLRGKEQHISNQINEIRNPQKKKTNKSKRDKKPEEELTPEQKKEKIESLKAQLSAVQEQRLDHEILKEENENKIQALNEQFPTIPMMQHDKNTADSVVNAYIQLGIINSELQDKKTSLDTQTKNSQALAQKISQYPHEFKKPETFPENIQSEYYRYLDLKEALTFIIEHPNGGNVNALIKASAKGSIEQEMQSLSENPLVIQYIQQQERSQLEAEKNSVDKSIENLKQSISSIEKDKERYEKTASLMSKEDAAKKSELLSQKIRNTNEKEQMTKLPQIIDAIKTEIVLINSTIRDLETKLFEIQDEFTVKS